jgi:Zn-dependent protease/predicted transcriptional regulator
MKGSFNIGSVKEIKIYIHWSFILLLVYVFSAEFIRARSFESSIMLLLLVAAVFCTVLLHEMGHALMARRFGFLTKDIILLPIGGMARMDKLPESPEKEIKIALAGPAVNLFIALSVLIYLVSKNGTIPSFHVDTLSSGNWLIHFMLANVVLALFNLLPAFPMDGGRVLRAVLSIKRPRVRATGLAARTGQVISLLLVLTGLFFNPVLVLIGLFIFVAAQSEWNQTSSMAILKNVSVSEVMMNLVETVQASATLRQAVDHLLESQSTKFIVLKEGEPVGIITRRQLFESIERNGQDIFLEACMSRNILFVRPEAQLAEIYNKMQADLDSVAVVMNKNGILGYVDFDNIMEYIQYQKSLQKNQTHSVQLKSN